MRNESIVLRLALFCALAVFAAAQDSLEVLSQKAREAMAGGRYVEAAGLYAQMVKALPGEAGARFNLALALDAADRPHDALKQLEMIRAAEARNPQFWFLLGIEYQKMRQPAKAVDPLERATKLAPANPEYRLELADAYLGSGATARAAGLFRALASEKPDNAKALAGLARSELAMSSDALKALTEAAPDSSFRFALAALAEIDKGERAKAAALYRRALAAQPAAPWLRAEADALDGATSVRARGDAEDAGHPLARLFHRAEFEKVVEQTAAAKMPEAFYWRARACSELARATLVRLAALPPSAEGHELAGLALRQAGRWEDSLGEYREAAGLAPGDRRLRAELAKACWLSRRYEEAATMFGQIIAGGTDSGEWEFELGDSLFNLGQPEQALPHLRRAAALEPSDFSIQAMLGRALLQTGDDKGALPVLEKAAKHDRDGSIHFQLANAYRHLGRGELARQATARQKEIEAEVRRRSGADAAER